MIRTASMIEPFPEPEPVDVEKEGEVVNQAEGGGEGLDPSPEGGEGSPLRPDEEGGPEDAGAPEDATEGQEGPGETVPAGDQDGAAGDASPEG